jgi:hypothetical protein
MSDADGSFGKGFGHDLTNPLGMLVNAICNVWLSAASTLHAMAAQTGGMPEIGRSGAPTGDLIAAFLSAMTRASAAMSDVMSQATAGSPSLVAGVPTERTLAQDADFAPLVARAVVVAAGSTLNYWRGLAEVYSKHQATMLPWWTKHALSQSPISEAERRLVAEELRGFLREVGDVALREARRLQGELEQIGENVASATDPANSSAPQERRWKAKEE